MKVLCVMVTCILGVTFAISVDESESRQSPVNYRLSDNVRPSNYVIEVEPIFTGPNNFTFNGRAEIIFRTLSTTNEIILHQNQLRIDETLTTLTLVSNTASQTVISGTEWNNVTHLYTLRTASTLVPSVDYRLTFVYTGILSDDMRGFYRSSYVENNETKLENKNISDRQVVNIFFYRWLATTQMQPTHARRVFPCFDEPKFKATFDIRIVRLNSHNTTVSNTRRINSVAFTDG